MKKKRKFPDQRIRVPKKGRKLNNEEGKTRINPFMEQVLFNLWSSGHTLTEIYEMYLDTKHSFSYDTLIKLKKRNNWDEKIDKLLLEIKINQENHIKINQRRQLNTIQMVIDMNADRIKRDCVDYFNDPVKYVQKYSEIDSPPPWLARDLGDLTKLTKNYSDIANVEKKVDGDDGADPVMQTRFKFSKEQKSLANLS